MEREIKILAIDSEDVILKSIVKALKNDGENKYIVRTCNTAMEGLQLIRNNIFNLVFLDVVLPGMSGNEALRRIKSVYPEIPVIIMSGFSNTKFYPGKNEKVNSKEEYSHNISGFLSKPFTIKEILNTIHQILSLN